MKKAQAMGFAIGLVVILISVVAIIGIIRLNFQGLDSESQNQICRAEIVLANKAAQGEVGLWGIDKIADEISAGALKHPLCQTVVEEIDLTDVKDSELTKEVALNIGERIENCWQTFGEGKLPNTFGQDATFFDDQTNYYFACSRIKFSFDDRDSVVKVSDLIQVSEDEVGLLWRYNTNGRRLNGDFIQLTDNYFEGTKGDVSYAAYVYNEGFGYIDFLETVDHEWDYDLNEARGTTAAVAGTAGTVGIVGAFLVSNPVGWVVAGVGGLSIAATALFSGSYDKQIPGLGPPLEELVSDQWYEVRYYSPYIEDPSQYSQDYVLNNIKIMPLGGEGGEEIESILE